MSGGNAMETDLKQRLSSDRVYLRQFTVEDHALLLELDGDPDVMKYLSDSRPSSDAEVSETFKKIQRWHGIEDGKYGCWAAHLIENREFIGWFHLRPLKKDLSNFKELELGYRLKKIDWGRGLANEMSKRLIQEAFGTLKAEAVWATTMKGNVASQRVMQTCGLEFVRDDICAEFPGEDKHSVWYRILS